MLLLIAEAAVKAAAAIKAAAAVKAAAAATAGPASLPSLFIVLLPALALLCRGRQGLLGRRRVSVLRKRQRTR